MADVPQEVTIVQYHMAMIVGQNTHVTWMFYKCLTLGMALIPCSIIEFLVAAWVTTLACCLHRTSQSLSTSRQDIQHCLPKNIVLTGDDVALTSGWQGHTDRDTQFCVWSRTLNLPGGG